jgi:hypothetical protein
MKETVCTAIVAINAAKRLRKGLRAALNVSYWAGSLTAAAMATISLLVVWASSGASFAPASKRSV